MQKCFRHKANGINKIQFIKNCSALTKILTDFKPVQFFLFVVLVLSTSTTNLVITITRQFFFESVESRITNVTTTMNYKPLYFFGCALLYSLILNSALNFFFGNLWQKWSGKLTNKLHQKITSIDPFFFEDQNFLELLDKAKFSVNDCSGFVLTIIMFLFYYFPSLLLMTLYLSHLDKTLIFIILMLFVPSILTQFIRKRLFSLLKDTAAPIRRENFLYKNALIGKDFLKETRIFGAKEFFFNLYKTSLKKLSHEEWNTEKKSGLLGLGMKSITLLGYLGVLILLFHSMLSKNLSVGAFCSIVASLEGMFNMMDQLVNREIENLSRNYTSVCNYLELLHISERRGERIKIDYNKPISLCNVYFRYPGSNKNVLENINIVITPGESIAIVGENGAGKTTLSKVILGLFLPTEGDVIWGENNTKNISLASMFESSSGVFQDYVKYQMTVKENIGISNTSVCFDLGRIKEVLQHVDIDLDNQKYNRGVDTILSKEFGGIELSGGEWQRIAIARGIYKPFSLIILDEPTASIDPFKEELIYNEFKLLSKGKTSIVITHRLGAARLADKIIVMDKGKIIETGTHEELIRQNGKYMAMYKIQKNMYV